MEKKSNLEILLTVVSLNPDVLINLDKHLAQSDLEELTKYKPYGPQRRRLEADSREW